MKQLMLVRLLARLRVNIRLCLEVSHCVRIPMVQTNDLDSPNWVLLHPNLQVALNFKRSSILNDSDKKFLSHQLPLAIAGIIFSSGQPCVSCDAMSTTSSFAHRYTTTYQLHTIPPPCFPFRILLHKMYVANDQPLSLLTSSSLTHYGTPRPTAIPSTSRNQATSTPHSTIRMPKPPIPPPTAVMHYTAHLSRAYEWMKNTSSGVKRTCETTAAHGSNRPEFPSPCTSYGKRNARWKNIKKRFDAKHWHRN